MSKLYYNGVLLPELPIVDGYPYCWIRKNESSGYYDLIFSKLIPIFNGTDSIGYKNGNKVETGEIVWYRIEISLASNVTEWTHYQTSTTWFSLDSIRTVMWSNCNIPIGSDTATDIYFYGSVPSTDDKCIRLVNKNQSSSNGTTSCSLTITKCTVGNTLILAYAVRGDGNIPTLTDDWIKLGGGNNVDTVEGLNQRLYFAYKIVTSETESVTLTQSTTGRIYLICSEYVNVGSVQMRNDLASIGPNNYSVIGVKSKINDIMVYGVTSAYYSSGRLQSVTPDDLIKIEGDSSQERLACWFDSGSGSLEHTFCTQTGFTEPNGAILECVQLLSFSITSKYLIKCDGIIYTVIDNILTPLETTELNANVFQTYGFDDVPEWSIISELVNPEILYWQDDTEIDPKLTVKMTATPLPQNVITNAIDLSDLSITGIELMTVNCESNPLFAVSFDNKTTWHAWNGTEWSLVSEEFSGMTKELLESITYDQWMLLYEGASSFYIRATITTLEDKLTEIYVDFAN